MFGYYLVSSINLRGFLNVIRHGLDTIEALSSEVFHWVLHIVVGIWRLHHRANHSLATLWVEAWNWIGLKVLDCSKGGHICLTCWILWNRILKIITEVCDKTQTVVKLHHHTLSIDRGPTTIYCVARTAITPRAFCLNLVLIHEAYSPYLLLFKLELIILWKDLNFVSHLMGTNFLSLEKVDLLDLLTNMELPHSINFFSQAMHWLICFRSSKKQS